MGFIQKIKLLFIVKKPVGEIADAVAEAKKTKKWLHFTATVLGIVTTGIAAYAGYMDPQLYVLVSSALNAIYNIVRGADKADNSDVKGTFTSTELYVSAFTEAQKFVVVAHAGGANYPWIDSLASFLNLIALVAGQNLAARAPNPSEPPEPKHDIPVIVEK